MKSIGVRQGSNQPELIERQKPEISPNCVLVRTVALGICGTDRDILASGKPRTPPGESYLILGHEAVGQVQAIGEGVTEFRQGDFVAPSVRRPNSDEPLPYRLDLAAWDEFTERGIYFQHGFSAEYWLESPKHLHHVPIGLESFAMLTEPFSIGEKAFNEAIQIQMARIGEDGFRHRNPRVLITGLGPIGFTAGLISLAHQFDTTIVGRRDEKDYQVQLAQSLGIDYLDSRKIDFKDFQSRDKNFDLIIECTGNDQLTYAVTDALGDRGIMVITGSERHGWTPMTVDFGYLMRRLLMYNQVLIGIVNSADPRDFKAAFNHMRWIQRHHPAALSDLITLRVPLRNFHDAYAPRQHESIKTIIEYPDTQSIL